MATAWRSSTVQVSVGSDAGEGVVGIVEDEPAWQDALSSRLVDCLSRSRLHRSWEFLPGMISVYETGRFEQAAQTELQETLAEVCSLLRSHSVA